MFDDLLRLTNQSVSTLADLLRRWMKDPLLGSVPVEVFVPSGETLVSAPHGLGRSMNGAIVVGQSFATPVIVMATRSPKYVTIAIPSSVSDMTVTLRVF